MTSSGEAKHVRLTTQEPERHTPGEWLADPETGMIYTRPGPLTKFVVAFTESGSFDEQCANARLIASAPDMLDALRATVSQVHLSRREDMSPQVRAVFDMCIAAIAKATPPTPTGEAEMALVPLIETDAMCEAGLAALQENLGHSAVIMRDAAACYRAMVLAALEGGSQT